MLQPATNLINVGSGGFGWRLALWCGPVRGLNPDGAGWPAGLHGPTSRAEKPRDSLFRPNNTTRSFFPPTSFTNLPEFLQRSLLISEEEAQQTLPLHKDDDGDCQEAG